jgi:hypothetical protein
MYGEQYLVPVNGCGAYFSVGCRIPDVRYDNGIPHIGKVHYDPHTDNAYTRDQYGNTYVENTRRGSVVIRGSVSTSVTYPVGHSGYTDAYGRQVRTRPELRSETPPRIKSKKVVYIDSDSDKEDEVVYVNRRTGERIPKSQIHVKESLPRSSSASSSRSDLSRGPMITSNGQFVEYFSGKVTCGNKTRWVGSGYTCCEDQIGRQLIITWYANGEKCSETLPL